MQDVFSLQVEECLLIKKRGIVVTGSYTGDIRIGTIIYDSDNNAFIVKGVGMRQYKSFEKIGNNTLDLLLHSDQYDAEYLKDFLKGKQMRAVHEL